VVPLPLPMEQALAADALVGVDRLAGGDSRGPLNELDSPGLETGPESGVASFPRIGGIPRQQVSGRLRSDMVNVVGTVAQVELADAHLYGHHRAVPGHGPLCGICAGPSWRAFSSRRKS
jgi:hypothetical protein